MGMTYKSNNGLTGVFEKGNFFGYKHYDLTVFDTNTKHMIYHATFVKEITFNELKEYVDTLPEFLEWLKEGSDDKSRQN